MACSRRWRLSCGLWLVAHESPDNECAVDLLGLFSKNKNKIKKSSRLNLVVWSPLARCPWAHSCRWKVSIAQEVSAH